MKTAEQALMHFDKARAAIEQCEDVSELKGIRDKAESVRAHCRRAGMGLELQNKAAEIKIRAERKAGEMLTVMEKAKGGQPYQSATSDIKSRVETLQDLGITRKQSSRWQALAKVKQQTFDRYIREIRSDPLAELNTAGVVRRIKRAELDKKLATVGDAEQIEGVYNVIVIDPPWPLEKIERDVRPNQAGLDYPTMDEAELAELHIPCADDCHVWLWTTHKFMPMAFRLLAAWDLKYVCTFVWHKPGGIQPYKLPQYNCEFALYARCGAPEFVSTKSFPVCFSAPRGKHSEKPAAFYDMVRRVTAGRRLDMFNRRTIDGFDGWGNEA